MIVVGVDGSLGGDSALAWAIDEAEQRHCPITAVRVWRGVSPIIADSADTAILMETQHAKLNGSVMCASRARPTDVPIAQHIGSGDPYSELALAASLVDAELIVVGRRGLGRIAGILVGSVSLRCAHQGARPAVIVPDTVSRSAARKRIVVGVDNSAESVETLRWAAKEALLWSAPLLVVHAYSRLPFASTAAAHDAALAVCDTIADKAFSGEEPRPSIELLAVEDQPASVLLRQSTHNDLLVVGAPAHHAAAAVLGSVASSCIARATTPVVIVRPR